jgi:hypothetical protein
MSHAPVKTYEIVYLEGCTCGGKKYVQYVATSKDAALKAFNKVMRKKTFRVIKIKEIS